MHKSLQNSEIWRNPWPDLVPCWEIPKIADSSPVKHQESVRIPKSPFYTSVIAWSNIKTRIIFIRGFYCRGKPSETVPLTFLQSPFLLFFDSANQEDQISIGLVCCYLMKCKVFNIRRPQHARDEQGRLGKVSKSPEGTGPSYQLLSFSVWKTNVLVFMWLV